MPVKFTLNLKLFIAACAVIVAGWMILLTVFVLHNSAFDANLGTQFSQSQASTAATQALAQQNALIFDQILGKFFNEQNWLCQAAVDHNKTLGGPPAPAGICDVQLPTLPGSPTPRASPTPG